MVGISLPSCGHKLVTNDHKLRLSPFPGSLLADSWERQLYVFFSAVFIHSYTTDLCRNGMKHRHATW